MSNKKPKDTRIQGEVHPLLEAPIPHAYALVPHPTKPGAFFAVHLRGVAASEVEVLEPSDRAEPATYGLLRIGQAMEKRHKEKLWTI